MTGAHFSKYAKAKRRKPPAPTPGKVLSHAEKAALLASRPDLQTEKPSPSRVRVREGPFGA